MADRTGTTGIDPDLFEQVWALAKELNGREKHFNDLQSRYRTLASTWLLAAFGGIGFVLSTKLEAPISSQLIVMSIALAGSAGIMLLWVLDVLVYHDLLVAGYVLGKQLEEVFTWIPPVRKSFRELTQGPAVRWYIAAFYISGITILCLIAAVSSWCLWIWFRILVILYWLTLVVLIVVWTKRALKRKRSLDKLTLWDPSQLATAPSTH